MAGSSTTWLALAQRIDAAEEEDDAESDSPDDFILAHSLRCSRCGGPCVFVLEAEEPEDILDNLCQTCFGKFAQLRPLSLTSCDNNRVVANGHSKVTPPATAWALVECFIRQGVCTFGRAILQKWTLQAILMGKPYGTRTIFSSMRTRSEYGQYPDCITQYETVLDRVLDFTCGHTLPCQCTTWVTT